MKKRIKKHKVIASSASDITLQQSVNAGLEQGKYMGLDILLVSLFITAILILGSTLF